MPPLAQFDKYEGLGNDFIVVDVPAAGVPSLDLTRALCDRRLGIGADGILAILPATEPGSDARMRVVNADGTIPEMCGNGLRCAVLHLARRRGLDRGELAIETDAGLRRCAFERHGDEGEVLCDMGIVRVEDEVVVDVGGERFALTRVDAGNPHAVALGAISREDFARVGPQLSSSPAFPNGANVEFVHPRAGVLEVLVWERGAGPTLACGTGACAVAAFAYARGLVSGAGPVRVRLPGGELEIRHDPVSQRTSMRGPARRVFAGTLEPS
jgi:diaminopimelate epimerase